jgi:DNA-binding response OmpR family regulator
MILIGHPQKNIAGLIAHRLSSCPDKVAIVTDGLSLVEKVSDDSVRLLVLDISICGENLEIVQNIRAMHSQRQAGIILFGVDVSAQTRQLAAEMGADMCISRKDVNSGRLIEIIKDFLPAAEAGRQLGHGNSTDRAYQLDGPFKWAPRIDLDKGELSFSNAMKPVASSFRLAFEKWKAFAATALRVGRQPVGSLISNRRLVPQPVVRA